MVVMLAHAGQYRSIRSLRWQSLQSTAWRLYRGQGSATLSHLETKSLHAMYVRYWVEEILWHIKNDHLFHFCQGRRDLNTVVHCYGQGQCTININPSTTAGEVRGILWTPSNLDPLNEATPRFKMSQSMLPIANSPLKWGHPSNQDTLTGPKGGRIRGSPL